MRRQADDSEGPQLEISRLIFLVPRPAWMNRGLSQSLPNVIGKREACGVGQALELSSFGGGKPDLQSFQLPRFGPYGRFLGRLFLPRLLLAEAAQRLAAVDRFVGHSRSF